MDIHDFDDIRPFLPEELPAVYDRLLANPEFRYVLDFVGKDFPAGLSIPDVIRSCKTNLEFQIRVAYPLLKHLIATASHGLTFDFHALDDERGRSHTFVSNHRDIVLDSAFLSVALHDAGLNTVEIAIGDNLLIRPWIKDIVRVNKSFIVQRALTMRQMLLASAKMSKYMHFCINRKNENIWIAQREGRAKDSNDLTQESVLKMMSMGGDLRDLNIVPLCISYEYDPCDYLKAREYQLRRDLPYWKKAPGDDMESMNVGIKGFKGHIHYCCAPCIDEWLQTVSQEQPRNKMFEQIAEHIDHEIHRNYLLYPQNYIALDMIQNTKMYADHYTQDDFDNFEEYIASRLALIDIENKDEAYLRRCLLTQYAYPTRNYLTATETTGRLKQFFSKFNFTK